MGLKERFAESYAKSKTMSGPEKRANEIMGKLLMKKAIIPIVAMIILIIVGAMQHINGWIILAINLGICVATFFYIRKQAQEFQNFTPYVGNLISLEQKGKNTFIKNGKRSKI